MFDIGFWELLLILFVALMVIGPERLPRAARVAGHWFSRARSFLNAVRTEVDRQVHAAELRERLEQSEEAQSLRDAVRETRESLSDVGREHDGKEQKGPRK